MTERKSTKISAMQVRVLVGLLAEKAQATRSDQSTYEARRAALREEYEVFNRARREKWPAFYVKNIRRALAEYVELREKNGAGYTDSEFTHWANTKLSEEFSKKYPTPEKFTKTDSRNCYPMVHFYALDIQLHVHPDSVEAFKAVGAAIDSAVLSGDLSGIQEKIAAL